MVPRTLSAVTAFALASALAACGADRRAPSIDDPADDPADASTLEPVALGDAPLDYKAWRKQQALRGLTYDTGRLVIVPDEAAEVTAGLASDGAERELARGRDLLRTNLRLDAIAAFTRGVLLAPDDARMYVALGDALLARRWSERAIAAYRSGVDVAPDSALLHAKLADALGRAGRTAESVVELRAALRLDSERGETWSRLAIQLYYLHDYADAWQAVHRAQDFGSDVPAQFRALLAGVLPDPEAAQDERRRPR